MILDMYELCVAALAAYLAVVIMMVAAALMTVIAFEMMGVRSHG
jgi:hypothetical protein